MRASAAPSDQGIEAATKSDCHFSWQSVPLEAGSLDGFGANWDSLNDTVAAGHPALTANYWNQMLRFFGDGTEHLCIERDTSQTVTSMCLLRRRDAKTWFTFMPASSWLGPMLIRPGALARALIMSLPGRASRLDLIGVDDRYCGLVSSSDGFPCSSYRGSTVRVGLTGGFERYWSLRDASFLRAIESSRSRLERIGRIEYVKALGTSALAAAVRHHRLQDLGAAENFQPGDSTEVLNQQDIRAEFFSALASTTEVEAHELWVGGSLAASHLMLRQGGQAALFSSARDRCLDAAAPALALRVHVLRDAFNRDPMGSMHFCLDPNAEMPDWYGAATSLHAVRHSRYSWMPQFGLAALTARNSLQRVRNTSPCQAGDQIEVIEPSRADTDVLRLLDQAAGRSVQCGVTWMKNFHQHVQPLDRTGRWHVLRRHGEAVAVLPVFIVNAGARTQRVESLTNYYSALYAPALAPGVGAAELASLLCDLRRRAGGIASVRFAPMDTGSREYTALRDGLAMAGLYPFQFFCFGNWYQRCAGLDWPSYLASLPGVQRSTIKRRSAKFRAEGGRLEILTGPEGLAQGIAAYEQVYGNSWKVPEPYTGFIGGLIESCAKQGWLRLGLAWMGDRPIAAQLWIVANGRAEIYKLAYDEAYSRFSVGSVLTALMMKHVLEHDDVHEIDYLIGDDAYKKTWVNQRRERWGLIAYDPHHWLGMLGLARESVGRAAKAIRHAFAKTKVPA